MGIKGADLEDEFLFQILAAFRRTLMKGKVADSHVLFNVAREIKMTSDWLRCIFVMPSLGIKPGPHLWEASALTTVPSLHPLEH